MALQGDFELVPTASTSGSVSSESSKQRAQTPPKAIFLRLSDDAINQLQLHNSSTAHAAPWIHLEMAASSGSSKPQALLVGETSYPMVASTSAQPLASDIMRRQQEKGKGRMVEASSNILHVVASGIRDNNYALGTARTVPGTGTPLEKTAANMGERIRERNAQLEREKESKKVVLVDDQSMLAGKNGKGKGKKVVNKGATSSPLLKAASLGAKRAPSPGASPRSSPQLTSTTVQRQPSRLVANEAIKDLKSRKEKERASLPPAAPPPGDVASNANGTSTTAHRIASSSSSASSASTSLASTASASTAATSVSIAPPPPTITSAASPQQAQNTQQPTPKQPQYLTSKIDVDDLASASSEDEPDDVIPLARRADTAPISTSVLSTAKPIASGLAVPAPEPVSNGATATEKKEVTQPPKKKIARAVIVKKAKKAGAKTSVAPAPAPLSASSSATASPVVNNGSNTSSHTEVHPQSLAPGPQKSLSTGASPPLQPKAIVQAKSAADSRSPSPSANGSTSSSSRSPSASPQPSSTIGAKRKSETNIVHAASSTLAVPSREPKRPRLSSPGSSSSSSRDHPIQAKANAGASKASSPQPAVQASQPPVISVNTVGLDASSKSSAATLQRDKSPHVSPNLSATRPSVSPNLPAINTSGSGKGAVDIVKTESRGPSRLSSPVPVHPLPARPGSSASSPQISRAKSPAFSNATLGKHSAPVSPVPGTMKLPSSLPQKPTTVIPPFPQRSTSNRSSSLGISTSRLPASPGPSSANASPIVSNFSTKTSKDKDRSHSERESDRKSKTSSGTEEKIRSKKGKKSTLPVVEFTDSEEGEVDADGESVDEDHEASSVASRGRSKDQKPVKIPPTDSSAKKRKIDVDSGTDDQSDKKKPRKSLLPSFRKSGRAAELVAQDRADSRSGSLSRAPTPQATRDESAKGSIRRELAIRIDTDEDFRSYSNKFSDDLFPVYTRMRADLMALPDKLRSGRDVDGLDGAEMMRLVDEINERGQELERIRDALERYNDSKRRRKLDGGHGQPVALRG